MYVIFILCNFAVVSCLGLVFVDTVGDSNNIPQFVKYKIRQDVDYTPGTNKIRHW